MTDVEPRSTSGEQELSRVHGVLFVATGAALLAHIFLPVPMPAAVAAAYALALAVIFLIDRGNARIGAYRSSQLVRSGFLAAVPALVAYDLSRLLVSVTLGMEIGPFDAFPHFGSALVGEGAPTVLRWVVGSGFHVINGVTFGIAYALVVRRVGVVTGIAWGLALEAIMLGVYPWWLQIEQLGEFLQLSIIGHVCYGATLGALVRNRLARRGSES